MQYSRISTLVLLVWLLAACEGNYQDNYAAREAELDSSAAYEEYDQIEPPRTAQPLPPPGEESQQAPNQPSNLKIIYTGSIRMQIDRLDQSMAKVAELVNNAGGYISNQHMTDNHYEKTAELTIRLPVERFQPAMNSVTQLATFVNSQNLDSRDVSAQWIDLESRLATKREVRDRYIEVLRKRAVKVEDILEAEDKIRVITEEIEAKEGQLRYLRDQVSMSTLNLTMYQTQHYQEEPDTFRKGFGQKIIDSLADGWGFVQHLVLLVLSVWPIWFLVPFLIWIYRRWKK